MPNSKRHATKPFAGVVIGFCLLLASHLAVAAPYTPASDTTVLERLPLRANRQAAQVLIELRQAVKAHPDDADAAAQLAEQYFDTAAATGDPRYAGYARAVVVGFAGPLSPALLMVRGMLQQYQHDFDAALKDFSSALAQDQQLAAAHAWRGAIYLVQAKYPEADTECASLQRLGRPALWGACKGLVQAYGGQLEAAYNTLSHALAISSQPGNRLWLLTRMAEVATWRQQPQRAEEHFRAAMALKMDDSYLLAAWSDFLLDLGRYREVAELLGPWEAADPLLLRLALAQTALQLPTATRSTQTLGDRFAAATLRGDTTHRAEEARYYLLLRQDARQALRLAALNFAVQREPRDARILLEAAIATGDAAAAQSVRDWLQRSGFEDPRLRALAVQSAKAGAP
jgi:Tfp pilus assembly protein PilF